MSDDVVQRVATETADLPNRDAWERIEVLLALAGVPRRDWMKRRGEVWAERKRRKANRKSQ